MAIGVFDKLRDELEGEFGKRLEEATEATTALKREVKRLTEAEERRARVTEDLVEEIRGLRRDLDDRD